jgi:predicted nucleotidyltransferase component of viral defense system
MFAPAQPLRLKIETNCREHFPVLGLKQFPFLVNSSWFSGSCNITTYTLEELLGTKLRALYQRRKGRDLFDLFKALTVGPESDPEKILNYYRKYMSFSVQKPPTSQVFLENLKLKIKDPEFLGDIKALVIPGEQYDPMVAFELIVSTLLNKIE